MTNELYHYGVKGMRRGVRRYQNQDGTLTAAGKKRYRTDADSDRSLMSKPWGKLYSDILKKSGDWYNSEGVSEGFKEVIQETKDLERSIAKKYEHPKTEEARNLGKKMSDLYDEKFKAKSDKYDALKKDFDDASRAVSKKYEKYDHSKWSEIPSKTKLEIIKDSEKLKRKYSDLGKEHDRIEKEIYKDPEFVELSKKYDRLERITNAYNRATGSYGKITSEFQKKRGKLDDKLAGIVLKDLGYRDTEAGRKFLLDQGLIFVD